MAETNASGTTTAEYIFFAGKRIALLPAGSNAQYYVEDFLGSSRVVTQNNGAICYDADFPPYGQERAYSNACAQNAYKFEGKERDSETQNDEFGARNYSWRFGRWLSADWSSVPVAVPYANLTNPQTLNLYAMVADDPESFADLDGHAPSHCFGCDNALASWNAGIAALDCGAGGYMLSAGDECGESAAEASAAEAEIQAQETAKEQASKAQNRQPDGSYKATPAQLEEIKAADKNGTTIKTKNDTKGECVTACEHFTGVPGPTSSWKGGKPASELTDKDKGTAIATFIKGSDGEWHYLPDANGHKNSGVFMGTSTKGTFWMADQWPQGKPVSIWNVGSNPDNASMNAASYRVIIVPNP